MTGWIIGGFLIVSLGCLILWACMQVSAMISEEEDEEWLN